MTLTDLIAALERAEGASRELDAEISVWAHNAANPDDQVVRWVSVPRPYTSSLDAALSLFDGKWFLLEGPKARSRLHYAEMENPKVGGVLTAKHRTPAIAMCLAALKARA
jgi:hypothetical protein